MSRDFLDCWRLSVGCDPGEHLFTLLVGVCVGLVFAGIVAFAWWALALP